MLRYPDEAAGESQPQAEHALDPRATSATDEAPSLTLEWAEARHAFRLPPPARRLPLTAAHRRARDMGGRADQERARGFFDAAPLLAADFDRIVASEMADIVACLGAAPTWPWDA